MTSFLGVPIRLRGVVYGNLYLTDKAGGEEFTAVDQELVVGLAVAAGLAIENARLHEHAVTAGLLTERERIARDLHDDVIQRLFATGLSLQAAAQGIADPATVERITRAVEEVNMSIRQIRSTIFELNRQRSTATSLRSDVLAVCDEAGSALGFRPSCDIQGPIDSAVVDRIGTQLLLCIREGLSNVARHAAASSVHVAVARRRRTDWCSTSSTTGRATGPRPDVRRAGSTTWPPEPTRSVASFSIEPGPDGGTVMSWSVPLGT